MGNKRNKQISVFIILFLFVLGMYLDTFKVHSAFSYAVGDMDSSCIASVASGFADTHVCTAGMLSSRGDRSREQITFRLSLLRRDTGKRPDFLSQNTVCPEEDSFCSVFEEKQSLSENQQELITNYIHNSDGKKRIS